MFNQKNSYAARIAAMLMLVLTLIFYIVLSDKDAARPAAATATPTITTVPPTRTPTPTVTFTPTPPPSPTVTPTPKPAASGKAKAENPELVARVDRALESLVVEFQPPVRNANDTGWLFPWRLTHFTPPVLTGLTDKKAEKPNKLSFQLILIFNIHPVGMDVSKGVFKVGVTNGQVEILDSEMPACDCEFSIQGWYHSSPYSQVTAWMPWQKLQAR